MGNDGLGWVKDGLGWVKEPRHSVKRLPYRG